MNEERTRSNEERQEETVVSRKASSVGDAPNAVEAGPAEADETEIRPQNEPESTSESDDLDPAKRSPHEIEPLPEGYSRISVLLDCVSEVKKRAEWLDEYLAADNWDDIEKGRKREFDSLSRLRNAAMSVTAAPEGQGREAAKVARAAQAMEVLSVFQPEEPHDGELCHAITVLLQTGNLNVLAQIADAVEVPELGLSSNDQIGNVLTGPQDELLSKTEIPRDLVFDVVRCVAAIMACAAPAPVNS